jgi:[ribosomal protein S18]-alanine N-acetyltransferase
MSAVNELDKAQQLAIDAAQGAQRTAPVAANSNPPALQLCDVLQAMATASLPQVVEVERLCNAHPWSSRHFADSMAAGHTAQMCLTRPQGQEQDPDQDTANGPDASEVVGYFVAMLVLDEAHLLNLAVSPRYQAQGCGRFLLQAFSLWAQGAGAQTLWLEVRASNARALNLYRRFGFVQQGVRKAYYPVDHTPNSAREDAVVMSCKLSP